MVQLAESSSSWLVTYCVKGWGGEGRWTGRSQLGCVYSWLLRGEEELDDRREDPDIPEPGSTTDFYGGSINDTNKAQSLTWF